MKLKSKLIGILGTTAITLTALTTVVACKEEEKIVADVVFTGNRSITPTPGLRQINIGDFILTHELEDCGYDAIGVKSTNSKVSATIHEGEKPTGKFTVDITVKVADTNIDQKESFGLLFTFYKNGGVQRRVRISSLTFNYVSSWVNKQIVAVSGSQKLFAPTAGQTTYSSMSHFELTDGATLKDNESIKMELTGADAAKFSSEIYTHNSKISFTLKANQIEDEYKTQNFSLGFKFTIFYAGVEKRTYTFDGYTFRYTGKWAAPTVSFEGHPDEIYIEFETAEGEPHVKYISDPNNNVGFKLSQVLEDDESVEADVTNAFLNVKVTKNATNNQWLDLDISINEDQQFDPYTDRDYQFTLSFVLSKTNFPDSVQTIFTHNFKVGYKGKEKPSGWSISFPTNYTSYSGEKRLSLIGHYQLPNGMTDLPPETPLKSITLESVTSTEGSNIIFNKDRFENGYEDTYEYGFVTMFLDITNKADWTVAEDFTLNFHLEFEEVAGFHEQDLTMKISYTPYDDFSSTDYLSDPEKYLKDRSMVLSCLYPSQSSLTNEIHHSGTAWIVGDATPEISNDYKYNVVTTWKQKTEYENWVNEYASSGLYFGVSDTNMTMAHEDGNFYSLIDEHMYYVDTDGIDIMTDEECKDNFLWQEPWSFFIFSGNGQGINASVIQIDFEQIAQMGGKNIYRNYEHQRDIYNKLDKLQAYKAKNGVITDLQGSSTTESGIFYIGGADETALAPFEDKIQHTAYVWHTIPQIQLSTIEGGSDDTYIESFDREDTSIWEEMWGTDAALLSDDIDWLTSGWKYVKKQNANWWGQTAPLGSMLLQKDNSGKWFVSGLYTGYDWSSGQVVTTSYPRFDKFYGNSDVTGTTINILQQFNG